jgi:transcriptional regulator with XRE-family HTH domain
MEFSERLSELMEEREITAYKLSKDTGIAQSTLSEVINNKNKTLSTQNITKIANYFGCTIDYLLGRSPFRSPSETRYSITVAAIKKILHGETFKALGYDELIWKAAIDITELLYADDAVAFIKSLHKKQNPTDAEYYKLSKFVTASINWPDDFSGPVALNIQGEKITVPLNYWDIPRIRFFEGYFDEPGSEYAAKEH